MENAFQAAPRPTPEEPTEPTAPGGRADLLESDRRLKLIREEYTATSSVARRGELAVRALEEVESQLRVVRDERQRLDAAEGTLWSRRNRLERLLISTRGAEWWRNRREEHRGRVG